MDFWKYYITNTNNGERSFLFDSGCNQLKIYFEPISAWIVEIWYGWKDDSTNYSNIWHIRINAFITIVFSQKYMNILYNKYMIHFSNTPVLLCCSNRSTASIGIKRHQRDKNQSNSKPTFWDPIDIKPTIIDEQTIGCIYT